MSMSTRENLITALEGGTPERTPLSFYSWMADDFLADEWKRLYDQGLGICHHCSVIEEKVDGLKETRLEERRSDGNYLIQRKETPVGTLQQVHRDGWQIEYWIKTPADYRVMTWITEHTELLPRYEVFGKGEQDVGDWGLAVILASRTPAMQINVDWAGTEQFCLDLAMELPELFELYKARKKLFLEESELIARGPGRFVKWLENLTISMMGPQRYSDLLVPVYDEAVPIMEKGDKRVMVHYDGELQVIADQIATAPFHMIESLTEPPEGNMLYDACRAAWPDKVFWANINVDLFHGPTENLRQSVIDKRQRAGKRAFAFEISEDLATNWRETVPIVLETLRDLD
jgi:hypothetical protein